jgi:hypothetical protein
MAAEPEPAEPDPPDPDPDADPGGERAPLTDPFDRQVQAFVDYLVEHTPRHDRWPTIIVTLIEAYGFSARDAEQAIDFSGHRSDDSPRT